MNYKIKGLLVKDEVAISPNKKIATEEFINYLKIKTPKEAKLNSNMIEILLSNFILFGIKVLIDFNFNKIKDNVYDLKYIHQ